MPTDREIAILADDVERMRRASADLSRAVADFLRGWLSPVDLLTKLRRHAEESNDRELADAPFVLRIGRRRDRSLFWYRESKCGKAEGWTPERECVRDLTAEEIAAVVRLGVTPDWMAPSVARATEECDVITRRRGGTRSRAQETSPPKPSRRAYGPDLDREVRRRRSAGESILTIAAGLGVSHGTVTSRLGSPRKADRSLPTPGPRQVDDVSRQIAEKIEAGQTIRSIADDLGISWHTVHRRIKDLQALGLVPPLPRGRRPKRRQ